MAAPAAQTAPITTPPVPAIREPSCCKQVIQTIQEIAIQILVGSALAVGLFFTFPVSLSLVLIPVAVSAAFIAMNFFFEKVQPLQIPASLPIPRTAPMGLANVGNDCWLNSFLQMVLLDRGLNKWFREVPDQLDTHAGYLTFFSQEILENLPNPLPEEAYGALAVGDPARVLIDNYAALLRAKPEAEKAKLFTYMQFLRKFPSVMNPAATPQVVARTLLKFKDLVTIYDQGQANRPGEALRRPLAPPPPPPADSNAVVPARPAEPALYNSHDLRMALGTICPQINRNQAGNVDPNSQQDPTEVLPWIGQCLLPDHLKMQIQERQHYGLPYDAAGALVPIPDVAAGAQLVDGKVIVKNEDLAVPMLSFGIQGSFPNMQDFLSRYFDEPNHDSDNRIKRQIDGVEYVFPSVKTERQILHAPSSLWLPSKRFCRVASQWIGLHRMIPSLFDAEPARIIKFNDSVEFQEIIEIQPVHGDLARYELDGFILHRGGCAGGHYVSYKRGVDDQGNQAWFLMDDSRITRVSDEQMRAALEKAYIPHYSRIEGA